MKTREFPLTHGWTIVIPETYSVYVNVENSDKFSIHDGENDQSVVLITEENSIEVDKNRYDATHKVNISNRSFTFFPYLDEE
ncbi:hypothetical protein [Bacillus sp. JJ722]|uniref:hypothetical protein n=1 Tax=Bacillus sp. JJ722 TaxID=3122973 RepID=UPI002FFE7B74